MKLKVTGNTQHVLMMEKGTQNAIVRDIETNEIIKKTVT